MIDMPGREITEILKLKLDLLCFTLLCVCGGGRMFEFGLS